MGMVIGDPIERPAPRVLVVEPEFWTRAFLRAELIERGHDAIGAPSIRFALAYPRKAKDRGEVSLVLVDQGALEGNGARLLSHLKEKFSKAKWICLSRPTVPLKPDSWDLLVRKPVSIGELCGAVEKLLNSR